MKQIKFNEQEEQAFMAILDAAARHAGLQVANAVAFWQMKNQNAEEVAEKEPKLKAAK